jgi:hypothetical protein
MNWLSRLISLNRIPSSAAREFASKIPVLEGGPAQRGEPCN